MKTKFKLIISLCFICCCAILFSGCASGAVDYFLTRFPEKIVYEKGEVPNFDGVKVETSNSDGTNALVRLKEENFSRVDTSTSGEKKVEITKNGLSTAFNIYIADIVVNDSDNLKEIIANAKDGNIIYLKQGNYEPKDAFDTRYKDVVIDKSLTIIGDGKDKTKFFGNFIVGANLVNNEYKNIDNFKDVKIMNIGFELPYTQKDNFIYYSGPYGKVDYNGAIRAFNTQNLSIIGCGFKGYAYGILGDDLTGFYCFNNNFRNILKNAIKTTKNTKNATIHKNIFMDIATNVISVDNNTQSSLGAIELSFAEKGNVGAIVAKNTFTRIGLHNGKEIYYDESAKTFANQTNEKLYKMSYVNNSSIITLKSSTTEDLEVNGIILSTNNYGQTLTNIRMKTIKTNSIDQNGVILVE